MQPCYLHQLISIRSSMYHYRLVRPTKYYWDPGHSNSLWVWHPLLHIQSSWQNLGTETPQVIVFALGKHKKLPNHVCAYMLVLRFTYTYWTYNIGYTQDAMPIWHSSTRTDLAVSSHILRGPCSCLAQYRCSIHRLQGKWYVPQGMLPRHAAFRRDNRWQW